MADQHINVMSDLVLDGSDRVGNDSNPIVRACVGVYLLVFGFDFVRKPRNPVVYEARVTIRVRRKWKSQERLVFVPGRDGFVEKKKCNVMGAMTDES